MKKIPSINDWLKQVSVESTKECAKSAPSKEHMESFHWRTPKNVEDGAASLSIFLVSCVIVTVAIELGWVHF